MIPENWLSIILRLALAVVLGGIIGLERAGSNHDAGLRTHILVCLGACGVMVMSEAMTVQYNSDIARMGAQVISGIGFLGAGCILISGNRIRGLTTAAGLWTTACIGLAIGLNYYFISISMTVLMLLAMLTLRPLGTRMQSKAMQRDFTLRVELDSQKDLLEVTDCLCAQIEQISAVPDADSYSYFIKLTTVSITDQNRILCALAKIDGVRQVERV